MNPGNILMVTINGGGNSPPMLALAKRARQRGHSVVVLGPPDLHATFTSAGIEYSLLEKTPVWSEDSGRGIDDNPQLALQIMCGTEMAQDVIAETKRRQPDLLLLDALLPGAFMGAESLGAPHAVLAHTLFYGAVNDENDFNALIPLVNEWRSAMNVPAFDPGQPLWAQLWSSAKTVLGASLVELDDARGAPGHYTHVGPILDPEPPAWTWDLPWAQDDERPLLVVSFSTTYMRQEGILGRVLDAVAALPARVLVTLGPSLEPGEVSAPDHVAVRQWVPHDAILPHASAMVTHAGLSTVHAALAHGVPMVCIPQGRDQPANAARVAENGAGIALSKDPDSASIRTSAERLLAEPAFRQAAGNLAGKITNLNAADTAVAELERVLAKARSA